jgi:hypothetical protein
MKRARGVRLLPIAAALAVLLVVLGGGRLVAGAKGAADARADDGNGNGRGCSLETFRGGYAYRVAGKLASAGAALDVEAAAVGLAVSDGRGHVSGHDWTSLNGATMPRTFAGTYTVASDCTGTAHVVFVPGGPSTVFFVLEAGGRGFKAIQTDPGAVISGEAAHT